MGIKEYLTGKKQKEVKYRLSDIVWVHNMFKDGETDMPEGAINVPFIPNKDQTKYKNLLTNEIVEMPLVFKGHRPTEHTLCKSVGLDYDNNDCELSESDKILTAASLMKCVSSKIIRDLGIYMIKDSVYGTYCKDNDLVWNFCKDTSVTQSQLVDLSNSMTKIRNTRNAKAHDERLRKAKENAEYEKNVRDF